MGVRVYHVPKFHKELFGNDNPRSLYFILMAAFDFWEMHPLRPELTIMYQVVPKEKRLLFKEKYVEEIPLTDEMQGVAPGWHFYEGVHKSWRLFDYLKHDKEIKVPLVILFGKEWSNGYVYEGHHRAGAARCLGWKSVPGIRLELAGIEKGYCNMAWYDREEMSEILRKKGLPDTSRIYGMKIHEWSEKELRMFMYPRPKGSGYAMQAMTTDKCSMDHPFWKDVPIGNVTISIRDGDFKLPWSHTQ